MEGVDALPDAGRYEQQLPIDYDLTLSAVGLLLIVGVADYFAILCFFEQKFGGRD